MNEIEIESAFIDQALEMLLTDSLGNPLEIEKVVITDDYKFEAVYYKFDDEKKAYREVREPLGDVYANKNFKFKGSEEL